MRFQDPPPKNYSLRIGLMQQYKNSPLPKTFAFELGSVAHVQHPLTLLEQMGIVQGSEHFPQVPTETIVQRVRRYTPGIEQLVEIVVPVGKNICKINS